MILQLKVSVPPGVQEPQRYFRSRTQILAYLTPISEARVAIRGLSFSLACARYQDLKTASPLRRSAEAISKNFPASCTEPVWAPVSSRPYCWPRNKKDSPGTYSFRGAGSGYLCGSRIFCQIQNRLLSMAADTDFWFACFGART